MTNPAPNAVIKEPDTGQAVWPTIYAGAIVVAGLYFGRDLLIPLVLASLMAFVMAPACKVLQRAGLPRLLAVAIVVLGASGVLAGIGVVVSQQGLSLADNIPTYEANVEAKWSNLAHSGGFFGWLTKGVSASAVTVDPEVKPAKNGDPAAPAPSFTIARAVAAGLLEPLATFGLVFIFTIFILISTENLRDRLVRLAGRDDLHRTILAMNDAARRLSRYFMYQLSLNVAFGTAIGLGLSAIGIPNPLLWGILAALMRFVPFVGVFIALTPPALLAVAVGPDWSLALLVVAVFLVGELIMGQVFEPLLYGHSTGLSPIGVIVAAGFWTLIWGPVGLLIATPLTVCLVVIGRHVEALSFLDILLGDTPPLRPFETFYQRALEGSAKSLLPLAKQSLVSTSLIEYYDAVALPGVALAQADLARDALGFERLEAIHGEISVLLDQVGAEGAKQSSREVVVGPLNEAWRAERSIICMPARGQLDDLAAIMAVQALRAQGFDARLEPNSIVGASSKSADLTGTRLICLSVLEQGSSVPAVQYFIRRLSKLAPEASIVVGLWHADGGSPMLASLRESATDGRVVLSIGELVALAKALSAKRPEQESTASPAMS